jgi:hypothetical protein
VAEVQFLFRIDIGFDPDRCYAAQITDMQLGRSKGVKGNSVEQLMGRLRHIIIDEMGRRRHFPMEKEEPHRIITPNGYDE